MLYVYTSETIIWSLHKYLLHSGMKHTARSAESQSQNRSANRAVSILERQLSYVKNIILP